jgi:hypothetical protein
MDELDELEALIRDVLAECTTAFVVGIERERRPDERKDVTRKAIEAWRKRFDQTVGKELREIADAIDVAAARAAWESADEGRAYVLRQISKAARRAYLESGFGWSVDDDDVDDAVDHVIERADKRFDRLIQKGVDVAMRKRWCD